MLEKTYKAITDYLNANVDEALDLARQMNSETGVFDWTEAWDWDELCDMTADGGKDAVDDLVRAAVYGNTYGGQVRYNAYGNLESAEEEDLLDDAADYMTDIIDELKEYIEDDGSVCTISVSTTLQDIIDVSVGITVHITKLSYKLQDDVTPTALNELPIELTLDLKETDDEDELSDEIVEAIFEKTGLEPLNYKYEIVKEEL